MPRIPRRKLRDAQKNLDEIKIVSRLCGLRPDNAVPEDEDMAPADSPERFTATFTPSKTPGIVCVEIGCYKRWLSAKTALLWAAALTKTATTAEKSARGLARFTINIDGKQDKTVLAKRVTVTKTARPAKKG